MPTLRGQLAILAQVRPSQRPGYAWSERQLRAEAHANGSRVVEAPWRDVEGRLKLLSAADQARVLSSLSRGEPALAYRSPLPGEPAGLVPIQFVPIKLKGKQQ